MMEEHTITTLAQLFTDFIQSDWEIHVLIKENWPFSLLVQVPNVVVDRVAAVCY